MKLPQKDCGLWLREGAKTIRTTLLAIAGVPGSPEQPGQEAAPKSRDWLLERMAWHMATKDGVLYEEQFDELRALWKTVGQKGGMLVIVDLPLPAWHREGSPHYPFYRANHPFSAKA